MVLYAAIQNHGVPNCLISDHARVFQAQQARDIYTALGMHKQEITPRQSWQNYVETLFAIQHRLADWHFQQTTTWAELVASHDHWVAQYNYEAHWAHRGREDSRQSPAEVLGWVRGTVLEHDQLQQIFQRTRFARRLDRAGYLRLKHWRMYGEQGLSGQAVTVWLYADYLLITFEHQPLASYAVTYDVQAQTLTKVTTPHLYQTAFQSPQLPLWEFGEGEWLKVVRLPLPTRRKPLPLPHVEQHRLEGFG